MINKIIASIWCAAIAIMFSIGAMVYCKKKCYIYCFISSALSLICSTISAIAIASI